ncbi:hypothetical protein [Salinarimonas rosea]|uniref:hypothetical protein n=1 Tax=Salinarimonas rosea TaxID=552063 RepID=UPI00069348E1|nr:hypothetical protein [Salinarimonas rosea]
MVRVHVNQHVIRKNVSAAPAEREPPLRVIRGRTSTPAWEVELVGPARVVYSPDRPLKCGARVWIEAADAVVLDDVADPAKAA